MFAALVGSRSYTLVLGVTIAMSLAGALLASFFPEPAGPPRPPAAGHVLVLRQALREVRGSRPVAGHVIALGVLLGIEGAMTEYVPLIYRHIGFSSSAIAVLLVVGLLTSTVLGWYLHHLAWLPSAVRALSVVAAGLLLLSATLLPREAALFGVLACMRVLLVAQTLSQAALQDVVADERRATIGSVASFGAASTALGIVGLLTLLSATLGDQAAYQGAAVLIVVAGAGLYWWGRRSRTAAGEQEPDDAALVPARSG